MGRIEALVGTQNGARVDPHRADTLRIQELGAERGRQQFTHGHDSRAGGIADAATLRQHADQLAKVSYKSIELRVGNDAQRLSEAGVSDFDVLENRKVRAVQGG